VTIGDEWERLKGGHMVSIGRLDPGQPDVGVHPISVLGQVCGSPMAL
jgi:hypothetical protein